MARMLVTFDGSHDAHGAALLMHNERLSDPLDPYTKWVAEISKKRTKPEQEIEEMARREWLGGGYWGTDNGPGGKVADPVIPSWNIIRCLEEAAKRRKLGRDVVRGIYPIHDTVPLQYDGPRDADEMWESKKFHVRKGVNVSGRKVQRTRPCFANWKVEAEVEVDPEILDYNEVVLVAFDAGRYVGLGDNRPRFGRFLGTVEPLGDLTDFTVPDAVARALQAEADASAVKAIKAKASAGNGRVKATA